MYGTIVDNSTAVTSYTATISPSQTRRCPTTIVYRFIL